MVEGQVQRDVHVLLGGLGNGEIRGDGSARRSKKP
jgi:hypothetical protein